MIAEPDSRFVSRLHPSPNVGPRRGTYAVGAARPSILLLHYTGMSDCAKAIDWLSRPESEVSCHYVIDELGIITQMVSERERAWHAGKSYWAGETDINSASIGIEIHNGGHEAGCPPYPERQMLALIDLSLDILSRNAILPERVLAHSDIAPNRKADPGEWFDWARLASAGVGHWVAPDPVVATDVGLGPAAQGDSVADLQARLRDYGYGLDVTGVHDPLSFAVVRAFQRHFRPLRVDGCIDASTRATLERLIAALPEPLVA